MSMLKLNYDESSLWYGSDVINHAKSAGYKTREAAILNWLKINPADVIVGKNVKVEFEIDGSALMRSLQEELHACGMPAENPITKLLGDARGMADFTEKVNQLLLASLAKVNVPNSVEIFEGQLVYPREIKQLKG